MKLTTCNTHDLLDTRRRLLQAISEVGEFRPGQLTPRYRRCGKPNCHCASPGDPGHGPSWSLTRVVAGKTVTRVIPAGEAVATTQSQLEEYRRFRALTRELIEVSAALCDARLSEGNAGAEAGKKKRSTASSTMRSKPKPSG